MLDLKAVDLDDLAQALEDHTYEHSWWLDPATGEVVLWSDYSEGHDEPDPGTRGLLPVGPVPSQEAYGDMEDFIDRVRDPRARDLLARAIQGRGAFRRFKDALFDLPELREAWFRSHDVRMARRALEWLADEELVEREAVEREIASRPDPELPSLAGRFDPFEIARAVADELRAAYGGRLLKVVLFGSWARGDAHPESDIDLLVVLDRVDSLASERIRMDEILWRLSFANDTVISTVVVGQDQFAEPDSPVVTRAKVEGRAIA